MQALSAGFRPSATPPACRQRASARPATLARRLTLSGVSGSNRRPAAHTPAAAAAAARGVGGAGTRHAGLLVAFDDELGAASQELQELCHAQLQLLTAALQLGASGASSYRRASAGGSLDEEAARLLDEEEALACLRCTVYCRSISSLQTGQLQLQLVAASDGLGSGGGAAQQAQAQRFLFLGQDGVAGSDQERWFLEQSVVVLPDSGGLVLPLAHNGFLVGLLVVERCTPTTADVASAAAGARAVAGAAAGKAAAAKADADADAAGAAERQGSAGGAIPQAPACLLFRSAELQLLKHAAAALALACAMDLRSALEKAGVAYRQRQASALVGEINSPLKVMRTFSQMLLPRLQQGEPGDRDLARGIMEQGSRLQEVVSQLQAALHPGAAAAGMPSALQPGASQQQQRAAGQASLLAAPGSGSSFSSSSAWQAAEPARPALPSSSIGGDYQGPAGASRSGSVSSSISIPVDGGSSDGSVSIDVLFDSEPGVVTWREADQGSSSSASSSSGRMDTASSSSSSSAGPAFDASPLPSSRDVVGPTADLANVLMPLLASASNFAAVKGVAFSMAEHSSSGSGSDGLSNVSNGSSNGGSGAHTHTALPAALVAVGPGKLKRMLSQLLDGMLACCSGGDAVQASVLLQQRQGGQSGVEIAVRCRFGVSHAAAAYGGGALVTQPEFAFLQASAADAGGWFAVERPLPDGQHVSSWLSATLWLPTVAWGPLGSSE